MHDFNILNTFYSILHVESVRLSIWTKSLFKSFRISNLHIIKNHNNVHVHEQKKSCFFCYYFNIISSKFQITCNELLKIKV